jgi:hypothetical protein
MYILVCNPSLMINGSISTIQKGMQDALKRTSIKSTSLQITPLLLRLLRLLREVVETQLVNKAEGHAGMLQHVVKRQILDVIVGAVNVRVRVLKSGLDNKSRGVTGLGGGSVVGAGIATLGLNPRDVAVL